MSKRQPLDELDEFGREPPRTSIAAGPAGKPGEAIGAIARQPPLRRAHRHPRRLGGGAQRHAILHVRAQHAPPSHRLLAEVLVQLGQ